MKLINEKYGSFDNIEYVDGVAGSKPSADQNNTNQELLKDLDSVSKETGIIPVITTAKTGHGGESRHSRNNAVDIAILKVNGKQLILNQVDEYNPDVQTFIKALEQKGYVLKGNEYKDKKVIGWYWMLDGKITHKDHLHISNSNSLPSVSSSEKLTSIEGGNLEDYNLNFGKSNNNNISNNPWSPENVLARVKNAFTTMAENEKESENLISEEIQRIKNLMK